MNGYLNYFIEANIGLVLFLAAYALLLRNETDFKIKRYFLLIGIFTSLTFPLLHIQIRWNFHSDTKPCNSFLSLPEFTITSDGTVYVRKPFASIMSRSGWFYLQLLYVVGLLFFLSQFIVRLFNLLRTIKNSKTDQIGKLKIVEYAEDRPTFSFFNFIILGQANFLSTRGETKNYKT